MVLFAVFFTAGVCLLQLQARLPDFIWAWCLAGGLLLPLTQRHRLVHQILIAVIACGIGFFHAAWQGEQRLADSLPAEWQGRDIEVSGIVAQLPHQTARGQRFRFDVERTLTPGAHVPAHLYLSSYISLKMPPPQYHAGQRWQLTVRLKQPHGSSNPHGFDFELWALENNVRAIGYIHNLVPPLLIDHRARGMHYRIEAWREAIRDKFTDTLGYAPYTGILTALAVGDQDSISAEQWETFRRTGVIHLMSISGLHITMLAGMMFTLVYWLWRRNSRMTLWLPARKAAAIAAMLTAYLYSELAGYGVPAQRTVFMVSAVAAALWLNRNFSLAQILSIALLGVLIADPWAVLSPGFLLSFSAVALILYTTSHRIGRTETQPDTAPTVRLVLRGIREYTTVQWTMYIGLLPLLLMLFGQLSLVSPIANAFAIPLISLVVVPLALAGAALPTEVPLWLAHIALDLTMFPLQGLSDWPYAVWIQHIPPRWSIATGVIGALWILLPRGFASRWLGGLLLLPMFLNTPAPPQPDTLRLTLFDVGQGLSVLAETRHHTLLYDTGPDYTGEGDSGIVIPTLHAMGIKHLDGLIISHDDADHAGGTASLLKSIRTDWVAASTPAAPATMRRCYDGISWRWDDVQFDLLHPGRNSTGKAHDNNLSCVLRISIGDRHILLPGDIEKRGEQRLLLKHPEQLAANFLVVPHHGSAGSSGVDFVAAVLPDYAVFTAGYRNRFGHPKEPILQRYLDSGATLLRSDQDGAILVEMDAQGIKVERYRITHAHYWTHRTN
ncbi:MAG TPA: DNA internalization-related competence protein ComEC/Rec2 [Gallionella sp.]|nr:MAG: DNA internalization-related competence protein ComEC/Rec2 [Gallionellales bacterium GWA2_54_124]HCI52334.1 DNA internalization-related competence protein ComEC/Rec2 [Gallionella sp.]